VKTISLKKVSAVAVASLGFGLLSVVPANAAPPSASTVFGANFNSISLKQVTSSSSSVVGGTIYTNFGGDFAGSAAAATTSTGSVTAVRAVLSSYPAGGFVTVSPSTNVEGGSAGTKTLPSGCLSQAGATAVTGGVASGFYITLANDATTSCSAGVIAASTTAGFGSFSFIPTVAGTYVLTVWNDGPAAGATTVGNGAIDATEAQQTVSITVSAAAVYSAALSTMHSITGNGTDAATSTTNADALSGPATVEATNRGAITVTLRNTANATMASGNTLTGSFTGSGGFGSTTVTADTPGASACATPVRTKTLAADAVNTFTLCSDGTSGVGTVTISVTDAAGATTVLGTKTITFYGTVATLTATVLQGIATPGAANGNKTQNAATQATLALTPAVVVVAKDANGVVVPGLTVTGKSADLTIVASSTTDGAVNGTTDKNGPGYYNFDVTGGASANVGKSTTIVYSTIVSSTLTISSAAVTIALAGTPATVTMTLDKTSYTPGAPVVITVTAKDAAGNAAADGTYANLFAGASTLGGAITGSTPAASTEIKGGVKTYTAYAPGTAGTYVVSNKFGTSMPAAQQGATVSASIVVSDPNAALLTQIDALNAKIVALNALIAKIMKKLGVK